MLHVAVEWKELIAAPRIKLLKEVGRTAIITPYMEAMLLKHAPQPLKDVLVIVTDSGMRPEEVMRLRWEHVLWEREVILVPFGKLRSRGATFRLVAGCGKSYPSAWEMMRPGYFLQNGLHPATSQP